MVLSVRTKSLIKNLAIPLLVGSLAGFLTNSDVKEFMATAKQPFFSPPGWVFPVVWTILYVAMGIGAARVCIVGKGMRVVTAEAIKTYAAQLAVNFFWSIIFFNFRSIKLWQCINTILMNIFTSKIFSIPFFI